MVLSVCVFTSNKVRWRGGKEEKSGFHLGIFLFLSVLRPFLKYRKQGSFLMRHSSFFLFEVTEVCNKYCSQTKSYNSLTHTGRGCEDKEMGIWWEACSEFFDWFACKGFAQNFHVYSPLELSKVLRFWFVFGQGLQVEGKDYLEDLVLTNQRTCSLLEFETLVGDALEYLIAFWIDAPSPWKNKWDPPKKETEIDIAEKYLWVLQLTLHLVASEDFICA